MNKTRNKRMDIVRGLGIILIVLGHSSFPYTHFIYLFHLSIFFILSGYFFNEKHIKDKESLKKFIINKVKRLYLPFVIGNIICVLLNNFFIDINLYDVASHNHFTIKDIIVNIVKVVLFRGHTELLGATWFLQILFVITILYATIEYIIKKYPNKTKGCIQLVISLVMLGIGYYLSIKNINIKVISLQVLTCYILFDLGRRISKHGVETKTSTKLIIMIVSFLLLVVLNGLGTIELSQHEYTNPIYFISVSILGWYFIYELAYFVTKVKKIPLVFEYIGKNTMPILIFHFISFKIVNLIGVIVLNKDFNLISGFPVSFKTSYWWIIYTLVGITVPILLNKIKKCFLEMYKKMKG